jgi:NAD(P)-dependent dehydrogenase (short-subunit alcohol dehydrogenase family)
MNDGALGISHGLPPIEAPAPRNVTWDFRGSTVMVTGAAHGQGRSHALGFAAAGADIVAIDLDVPPASVSYPLGNPADLERLATDVRALGVRCVSAVVDVRDEDAVAAIVLRGVAELGRIDVLVNNAGINTLHDVTEMPGEAWREMIDVNLSGQFHCAKHVARAMKADGQGGRIVTTGSVLSHVAVPMQAHYTAAKHGVLGLTKALAVDLAPYGITANLVCPAAVNTAMAQTMDAPQVPKDYGERLGGITGSWNLFEEAQRTMHPGDITQAVMWLASDSARFVTGAEIAVDCGFLAK